MKIMSYVELTSPQQKAIEDFEKVVVRTALIKPAVVATFHTFLGQSVKVTISDLGVIQEAHLEED